MAADVDGDGLNDILVVNNGRSKINVLYNRTGKTNAPVTASKVGYPDQCVNDPTNPTSAEWMTCTQKRAGTAGACGSISRTIASTARRASICSAW